MLFIATAAPFHKGNDKAQISDFKVAAGAVVPDQETMAGKYETALGQPDVTKGGDCHCNAGRDKFKY